ncbi:MAG: HAD family hydrolase [Alphaproteobacteria bacterium]
MNKPTPDIKPYVKYVIFDFDGVIADTESVFADFDHKLLNNVLEKANITQRLNVQDVRDLSGQSGEKKLNTIAQRFGFNADIYKDDFIQDRTEKRKTLFIDNPARLGKNIREFLQEIDGKSALATNKTTYKLNMDIKIMSLDNLFDRVVPCDPPMRGKPETDILLAAALKLGTEPYECAYIGDNTNDMIAAKNAGMVPVGFVIEGKENAPERCKALKEHGAHIVIDDFMDMKPYMDM